MMRRYERDPPGTSPAEGDARHEASARAQQFVPGDIVSIEAGDVVPADGRLLSVAMLEADDSRAHRESLPVSKSGEPVEDADTPLADRTGTVCMNTDVTRFRGVGGQRAIGGATSL